MPDRVGGQCVIPESDSSKSAVSRMNSFQPVPYNACIIQANHGLFNIYGGMEMTAPPSSDNSGLTSISRIVLLCFIAIIAFFLLAEHSAHVFGVLPYLLLLACPLMHLFMHGHHGGHDGDHKSHTGHAADHDHQEEGGQ